MTSTRKENKEKTRLKILSAASRLLKTKGFEGASVQKVMAEAQLSHGGFYAYFKDKDRMIIDSLKWAMEQTAERVKASFPQEISAPEKLIRFLGFYLSPAHKDQMADGCPVAALANEFSRAPEKLRKEFAKELNELIDQRKTFFSDRDFEMKRGQWIALMSTYVGALILSRSVADPNLSQEILNSALDSLKASIERTKK